MPYNPNIPQATDLISQSQSQILGNFTELNTAWNVNHVPFNSVNPQEGKHNFVSMPVQAADPGTVAAELAVYSKQSTLTALPQLFWQQQANGTVRNMTDSNQVNPDAGWSYLPSGLLIKWGHFPPITGPVVLAFPAAAGTIPVFANIFTLNITTDNSIGALVNVQLKSFTVLNMAVRAVSLVNPGSSGTAGFWYVALGN